MVAFAALNWAHWSTEITIRRSITPDISTVGAERIDLMPIQKAATIDSKVGK